MTEHLERYDCRTEAVQYRVGKRVIDCVVGLPPADMPINPIAVQLNTGIASGPTMFKMYGKGLNALGYATVIASPHEPSAKNAEDNAHLSEDLLEGAFGFDPAILSIATHSLGTHDTLIGLTQFADEELLRRLKDIIEISPVGYGGVQGVEGAIETVVRDVFDYSSFRHARGLALEAFGYTVRAGFEAPGLVKTARSCDLIPASRELIARGIGIGAVMFLHDKLIWHGPAVEGLLEAGITNIRSIPGGHTAVLSRWQQTLAAGLQVRDALDLERMIRESGESA